MASVDRVEDRLAIQEFFGLYAEAVDGQDWELYQSLFTDDAHIDYISGLKLFGLNIVGAKAGNKKVVSKWLAGEMSKFFTRTQHMCSNIRIKFHATDPNRAHVRALFHNPMVAPFPFWAPLFTVGGWYEHKMVKGVDGKWRSEYLVEDVAYFNLFSSILTWVVLIYFLIVYIFA